MFVLLGIGAYKMIFSTLPKGPTDLVGGAAVFGCYFGVNGWVADKRMQCC